MLMMVAHPLCVLSLKGLYKLKTKISRSPWLALAAAALFLFCFSNQDVFALTAGIEAIYSFSFGPHFSSAALLPNSDGSFSGVTLLGGTYDKGTVFTVATNGVLSTSLSFNFADGYYPGATLVRDQNGNLYGTTMWGCISNANFPQGMGTVFELTSGGVLTNLAIFNGTNGAIPDRLLLSSDGNLYGETRSGGQLSLISGAGAGTVFKLTPGGILTTLVAFNSYNALNPYGGLSQTSDGILWGTSEYGGSAGAGTIFGITTNGALVKSVFLTGGTNSSLPAGGLLQGGSNLFYGTTDYGGAYSNGTVFTFTTNGTLTTLFSFSGTNGATPTDRLVFGSDGTLWGTTYSGGANGAGTVFNMTTNGLLNLSVSLDGTNEGSQPAAGLVLGPDGSFYGTTYDGGSSEMGTVFKVSRTGAVSLVTPLCDVNGVGPEGTLYQDGNGVLWGTCRGGGTNAYGTVFNMTTNGTITTVMSFSKTTGQNPETQLLKLSDSSFYGTTTLGGLANVNYYAGMGTVFKVTTNGTLTTLVVFNGSNGIQPNASFLLGADGNLYGTTADGGNLSLNSGNGFGTVFKMTTEGILTNLAAFNGTNGSQPNSKLVFGSGGVIYGSTYSGGLDNEGTVFSLTPGGVITPIVSFVGTNGSYPSGGLLLGTDGNFYGTTSGGSYPLAGTVFKMTPGGVLTNLYSFTGGNGSFPNGWLTQGSDGNLYGTTQGGGASQDGTVFIISTNGSLLYSVAFNGVNGVNPQEGGLIQGMDGSFYGVTELGGVASPAFSPGTVFRTAVGTAPQITFPVSTEPPYFFWHILLRQFVGGTQVMGITATGSSPLQYQWQKNNLNLSDGGHISGSSSPILTLAPVSASDSGVYSVTVMNAIGAVYGGSYYFSASSPSVPALTNNSFSSNGAFGFTFTGSPNVSYHVWASTDLFNWFPLALATQSVAGSYGFSDTSRFAYTNRFYELRVP